MASLFPPTMLRETLVRQVRALFNDTARGQKPVERSPNAYCPSGGIAWRVHGDVTTMVVGGSAALLLQMLHPSALGGVWDHSNFRADMLGRLRNTARFMAVTTFGDRRDADRAVAHVRRIHEAVSGALPDGTRYRADDPRLLAWIHVAGSAMFLAAWIRFGEPNMSRADQDAYYREVAPVARLLGADPVPESRADADALIESFRPELAGSPRSRSIARTILDAPPPSPAAAPVQAVLMQAAIDLLPGWARTMHALEASRLARPVINAATAGLTRTLQWAFSGAR